MGYSRHVAARGAVRHSLAAKQGSTMEHMKKLEGEVRD
jgi:hypothetical protein